MSDSKFDDKIRDTLEGHEPEATPNWNKMRDRIAAAAANFPDATVVLVDYKFFVL